MLAKAANKKIYDMLYDGEASEVLATKNLTADLITAADVFIYIDDLSNIINACAQALIKDGFLIFSIENTPKGHSQDKKSKRYQHSETYIAETLQNCGFSLIKCVHSGFRYNKGSPIDGCIYLAQHRS